MLFCEPCASPASSNRSCVNAGLMEGKRAGAGLCAVVIAHHRHRSREVKRFAKSFERAHGDKMPEPGTPASGHGNEAPEKAAAQDEVLAAKSITDKPRERRAKRIHPHECRADETELHFIEREFVLEFWKDGKDGLAIGVVE